MKQIMKNRSVDAIVKMVLIGVGIICAGVFVIGIAYPHILFSAFQ